MDIIKSYKDRKGNIFYYSLLLDDGLGSPVYHNPDGPAIIYADGSEQWRINGKLHREDGPACIHHDGERSWYKNDKLHRLDGPAIVYGDETEEWWMNGRLHRIDGPAVEYADGEIQWWINGERLINEEIELWFKENNIDLKTKEGQLAFKLKWL